jgi:hypothetical protein
LKLLFLIPEHPQKVLFMRFLILNQLIELLSQLFGAAGGASTAQFNKLLRSRYSSAQYERLRMKRDEVLLKIVGRKDMISTLRMRNRMRERLEIVMCGSGSVNS